jgi:hypothetical protein
MDSPPPPVPSDSSKPRFDVTRLPGCCAGQALGCGLTFLVSWGLALLSSAFLTPLFGNSRGDNSLTGLLITSLTCGGSILISAVLSFLAGRLFPVLRRKGR